MCGIATLLNLQKERQISIKEVENMLHTLEHRGPDNHGIIQDGDLAMGLRRLSIIDLTGKGDQPMKKHNLIIAFNGCIYNYRELRDELMEEGINFESKSDTEVILSSYHQWGLDCFQRFNGMWAIVIFDKNKGKLIVSRDRFGIKPLYHLKSNNALYITSEIKAFKSLGHWKAKINNHRVYDFLNFGMKNHTQETLFQDVFSFTPGCFCEIDLETGRFNEKRFYSLDYKKIDSPSDFKESSDQFKTLFYESLSLRLRSDVKVSMSLSGGLDSSAIAIGLNELLGDQFQNAICLTSSHPDYDESGYAQLISRQTGIKLTLTEFNKDKLQLVNEVVRNQDEPFPGGSVIAQNLIYKTAKEQGIKVMLSGQGADEYLLGYDAFLPIYMKNRNPFFHPLNFIRFAWIHRNTLMRHLKHPRRDVISPVTLEVNPEKVYNPSNTIDLKERAYDFFVRSVLPALLHYEDRNSMAHGVESRLPFLDHRLVEYCFRLPESFLMNKGRRKYLLRESFKNQFPKKIYKRYDKSAFATPLNIWLKDSKEEYSELLAELGVNVKDIQNIDLFWRLVTYSLWRREFNIC